MSNVHFAYTVWNLAGYGNDYAWRNMPIDKLFWPNPIHAPFSITYFLLKAMREKYNTILYDLSEKTCANMGNEDIFLGHLYPKAGNFGLSGMQADMETIGWKTLETYKSTGRTCIIQPFVYAPSIVEMAWLERGFLELCDSFIAICGRHWGESWKKSPLCKNSKRFLRINMGIDATHYPFVRKKVNPKRQRRFLYIGHTSPYKNTKQLEAIAQAYPGFQGITIGGGEVKGWTKISDFIPLTTELLTQLAQHVDVFLSTSTADAQATTILEQMASGFAVACTPESGYSHPSIFPLDVNDTEFNCQQIHKIQEMEEDELLSLIVQNRQLVETEYNWNSITNDVMSFIDNMLIK